jgi:hypothetical protein
MPPRAETKKPPKGRAERAALLKPPPAKVERKPRAVIGQRVEVEVEFGKAEVTAFVLVKDRQLAARHWALTDEGILVHCSCEKEAHCQYNGLIYRPMGSDRIEQQIYSQIKRLAEEYQVPEKKISFWRIITGESFPERQLNLGARWKNAETLAQAQEGFDRMRRW